jgi:hypothetical protein
MIATDRKAIFEALLFLADLDGDDDVGMISKYRLE